MLTLLARLRALPPCQSVSLDPTPFHTGVSQWEAPAAAATAGAAADAGARAGAVHGVVNLHNDRHQTLRLLHPHDGEAEAEEAAETAEIVERVAVDPLAVWQELECGASGRRYFVHLASGMAQWQRPEHGRVLPLKWSPTRAILSLPDETKLGIASIAGLGLLAGGFLVGFQREQKRYGYASATPTMNKAMGGAHQLVRPPVATTIAGGAASGQQALAAAAPLRKRRLRGLGVSVREQAAQQAMRALVSA